MMVEAGSLEVSEDTVVEALDLPRANQKIIARHQGTLNPATNGSKNQVAEVPPFPSNGPPFTRQSHRHPFSADLKDASLKHTVERHSNERAYACDALRPRLGRKQFRRGRRENHAHQACLSTGLKEEIFRDEILNRAPPFRWPQVRPRSQIQCETTLLPRVARLRALSPAAKRRLLHSATLRHQWKIRHASIFSLRRDTFKRLLLHYNSRRSASASGSPSAAWRAESGPFCAPAERALMKRAPPSL